MPRWGEEVGVQGVVPVKLEFFDAAHNLLDRRRMRFENPTWSMVREEIESRFTAGSDDYQVTYVDLEGDVIMMSSDEEWIECVRVWAFDIRALRLAITFTSVAPRAALTITHATAQPAPQAPTCRHCTFLETGVTAGYCCMRCKVRPGSHGPQCARRTGDGGAAKTPVGGMGMCKNCSYAPMPGRAFCCKKCAKHPGKHGPQCGRVAGEALRGATDDDMGEYVYVSHVDVAPPLQPQASAPQLADIAGEDDDGDEGAAVPARDGTVASPPAGLACVAPARPPLRARYTPQISQLEAMGFFVDDTLLQMLVDYNGNVARVVDRYL